MESVERVAPAITGAMMDDYVHGYGSGERQRLHDQARTLEALLHEDTRYEAGAEVLEAGCGAGAQTLALIRRHPGARFTSIDRSAGSLAAARRAIDAARHAIGAAQLPVDAAGLVPDQPPNPPPLAAVEFLQADIETLPFAPARFDHVFVCFVLEHLPDPVAGLRSLGRVLRPGGTITVIEGDHGSVLMHPESAAARRVIDCQVALQAAAGGDACIGRRLQPLLRAAGFEAADVAPRIAYADPDRPSWADGFTRRTFIAMIEAVRPAALAAGLIEPASFDAGVDDLRRAAGPDGTFAYTFFKAVAVHR